MSDAISLIRSLLVSELNLAPDRVVNYNQKWTLPPGDGLFVMLSFMNGKPYSTGMWHEDTAAGLAEIQETAMQETYAIDLFSRTNEARERRHEILWALNSTAAQQMCEVNTMKLAGLPSSFHDLSFLEASGRLNRYQLTFHLLRIQRRERVAPYFNQPNQPTLLVEP